MLDDGYSFEQIAKILLINDQTARNYLSMFQQGGTEGLLSDNHIGYSGCLSQNEESKLATHPQYNFMPAYGWIKKGERKEIQSNTGRERLNINGVLNAETREAVVVESRYDQCKVNCTPTEESRRTLFISFPYLCVFRQCQILSL